MTADYTPTTDEIVRYYLDGSRDWFPGLTASERDERFYRWLAEVRRETAEKAWDEVADYLDRTNAPSIAEATRRDNPHRKEQP